MKKLLLISIVCVFLSCKKDAEENLSAYNWVISSATINPAITANGKTTKDYIAYNGCIDQLTLGFLTNGVYTISASAAACSYMANTDEQKWIRSGNKITLQYRPNSKVVEATVSGNKLTYTNTFSQNNIQYTVAYIFKAKKK